MFTELEEKEDEVNEPVASPRSAACIVALHDAFYFALEETALSAEQRAVVAIYHDAFCWVLGNNRGHVLEFLRELNRTMELAKAPVERVQ